MSRKRQQDDDGAGSEASSPEDKRRKLPDLGNLVQEVTETQPVQHLVDPVQEALIRRVREEFELAQRNHLNSVKCAVQEVIKMQSVLHLWEPVLEPLIRRVVRDEVALAQRKPLNSMKWTSGQEVHSPESRRLQLQFFNKLSLPVFTEARIEGEGSSPVKVALVDPSTGQIVNSGPESSAKVEIVVLEGDFDDEEGDNWTLDKFKNNIVINRKDKKPLLTGDPFLTLEEGTGLVGAIKITDNSKWTKSGRFRLGARVVDNSDGIRVREAKTESFIVKEHRGELYKKHYPPSLFDEVWRLGNIARGGAFHKRLTRENINTVKDFLTQLVFNSPGLRNILGTGMSAKMWEVTVEHARTCILDKRIFLYCPLSSQQKSGVVFNVVGQVMGLILECQFVPIDKLSETKKADAQKLVISAFGHWDEVVSFDDEASFMGSFSHLTNVLHTSSSPRMETSNGSKFLASQKMVEFDHIQPSTSSPNFISSIYSVGSVSGLDDYASHTVENMGPTCDQIGFPAQVTNSPICDTQFMIQAFCEEDCLQFFESDIQSQSISLESPADLQSAVDEFLLRRSIDKAQRKWTKLFSVLKFFSIRKVVASKRTRVQRYSNGL